MNRIMPGDEVRVYWEQCSSELTMEVLALPTDINGTWILERTDGTVVYVNTFAKMVKVNTSAPN